MPTPFFSFKINYIKPHSTETTQPLLSSILIAYVLQEGLTLKRQLMKASISTITALTLLTAPAVVNLPQWGTSVAQAAAVSVKLNGSSSVQLQDAQFLQQSQGKVLAFTVTYNNAGSTDLELIDYWVRVKSKDGKSYKLNTIEADKNVSYVGAKSTRNVTHYALVDDKVKLSDLFLEVIQWDLNSPPNYERKLGQIPITSTTNTKVQANKVGPILYAGTKLNGQVTNVAVSKDDQFAYYTISYKLDNADVKSTTLDKAVFYLQANNDTVYEVKSADLQNATLQPKESRVINFTSKIPLAAATGSLSLIVATNADPAVQIPLAVFALPNAKPAEPTGLGKTQRFFVDNAQIDGTVKQARIEKDDTYAYYTLNVDLTNSGSKSIAMEKVLFYIQSTGQVTYELTPSEQVATLLPKETRTITFNAMVPLNAVTKDIAFAVASNSENDFRIPLAVFALASVQPEAPTAVDKARIIYLNGQSIEAKAGKANATEIETNGKKVISFNMNMDVTNTGTKAITAPEIEFFIQKKDGSLYPLEFSADQALRLVPKLTRSLALKGELPTGVDLTTSTLLVRNASTGHLLGQFQISQGTTAPEQVSQGRQYTYKENYSIRSSTYQRVPMENEDFISTEIIITNTSNTAVSIPEIKGYFLINGVKVDPALTKSVALDSKLNIASKKTYSVAFYTKVPFTTDINKVEFVLTDPETEGTERILYKFTGLGLGRVPALHTRLAYQIRNEGIRSELRFVRSNVYIGDKQDIFYAEMELRNSEARATLLPKLGGYIQNSKGQSIYVNFSEIKERVTPDGRVLVSVWAKVPKGFESKTIKLLVGRAVQGESAEGEAAVDSGILKAYAYNLPVKAQSPITDLSKITFSNYQFSMSQIKASLFVTDGGYSSGGVQLDFNYSLNEVKDYANSNLKHKIRIEFVDQDSDKATYSKEFAINETDNKEETVLKFGEAIKHQIRFDDTEVQSKIQSYKNYVINIYDVFEGESILIASKQLNWFETQ